LVLAAVGVLLLSAAFGAREASAQTAVPVGCSLYYCTVVPQENIVPGGTYTFVANGAVQTIFCQYGCYAGVAMTVAVTAPTTTTAPWGTTPYNNPWNLNPAYAWATYLAATTPSVYYSPYIYSSSSTFVSPWFWYYH